MNYCEGHRQHHDGKCPNCTRDSHPGRRRQPCERWPGWNILAPGAGAVLAVMERLREKVDA